MNIEKEGVCSSGGEGVMMMVVVSQREGEGGGGHDDCCWVMALKGWRKIQSYCDWDRRERERDRWVSVWERRELSRNHMVLAFSCPSSCSVRKGNQIPYFYFYMEELSDATKCSWILPCLYIIHPITLLQVVTLYKFIARILIYILVQYYQ